MTYVEGFVTAVPTANKDKYLAHAREAAELIMEKGATRFVETWGDDVPRGVVFVTAHDEHAIRAFEVHALDYLLKPFGRSRFGAAVTRAVERLSALDASAAGPSGPAAITT